MALDLQAASQQLAAVQAERDEFERKGKSLCNWIGALLVEMRVSTPEAALDRWQAAQARERALREALQEIIDDESGECRELRRVARRALAAVLVRPKEDARTGGTQ